MGKSAVLRRASASGTSDFPHRLKEVRKVLHLTQTELAHVLGVSLITIQRWESRQAQPIPMAVRAVEALEILLEEARGVLSAEQAGLWFHTRFAPLGNRTPLNVLADPRGLERISHLLGQIEWGIPS